MVHTVSALYIYPIKSLGGIKVDQAYALKSGFQHDRRWMLVDENHRFLTQRECTKLALFSTNIAENELFIKYQEEVISFDLRHQSDYLVHTKVWDDDADTVVVSDRVSAWFSDMLGINVRLVKLRSESSRSHFNTNHNLHLNVSLADGYPYLLIGEKSLDYLNEKLAKPVMIDRFRPNIVVTTAQPHEEDYWQDINIGDTAFKNVKPCGRCMMITIDQQTGEVNNETLKVLNNYRKAGNSVLFGTNMMCIREGTVKTGDSWSN